MNTIIKAIKYFTLSAVSIVLIMLTFAFTWAKAVEIAYHKGRELRGGFGFGMSTQYAYYLLVILAAICVVAEYWMQKWIVRTLVHFVFLSFWCHFCWPILHNNPIRGGVFILMGLVFYILAAFVTHRIFRHTR